MLKINLSKWIFLFVAVMGGMLASCDDNNDEPTPNPSPNPYERVGVAYSLELSDAWWDFFDIEVTYTTANGETVTKTVTKGWVYAGSASYDEAPAEYKLTGKATPKATQPAIDTDITYQLDKLPLIAVYDLDSNDKQNGIIGTTSGGSKLTVPGNKLHEYVSKEHTNLANLSYELKK